MAPQAAGPNRTDRRPAIIILCWNFPIVHLASSSAMLANSPTRMAGEMNLALTMHYVKRSKVGEVTLAGQRKSP